MTQHASEMPFQHLVAAVRASGGKFAGSYAAIPGPNQPKDDSSLLLFVEGNRIGWVSLAGDASQDVGKYLQELGIQHSEPLSKARLKRAMRQTKAAALVHALTDAAKYESIAERLWARAVPIAGTVAEEYLRECSGGQTLEHAPSSLRFLQEAPTEPRWSAGSSTRPALIAAIANEAGARIGCHLTYLPAEGVAWCRWVGGIKGGRIILGAVGSTIVVGASIEGTLKAATSAGLSPTYALLAPSNIARFQPPKGVRRVFVVSRAEDRFTRAAERLRKRLAKSKITVEPLSEQVRTPS